MNIKTNWPLIGKITSILSGKSVDREIPRTETTESSVEAGFISFYYKKVKLERTRLARYGDYDIMDEEYPEIATALDIYADNATKPKENTGDVFEVKSDDAKVKNILLALIDRLKLHDCIWDTARNMVKRGDDFDEVVVDDDKLIVKLKCLEPQTMFKEQDEFGVDKEQPYSQKDESTAQVLINFERWQIVHWKHGGMKKMYGDAVLRPIRRVYKQLQLMEDGMVIGRLTRSHLRYKILVDTEGMSGEEALAHVTKVKNVMKKKRMINPVTGKLETGENPLGSEEDFFIPVSNQSKADVSTLQGATNLGNIRDVEYFQTKMFSGLKVPKAFVGLEKDVSGKATITEEDVQFARTVWRLRKGLRNGLRQIFDYQLLLSGVIPTKDSYEIHFSPISMVDELRKWTMEKIKAEVAKIYKVDLSLISDRFILQKFLGVPDEEIEAILREKPAPPQLPPGKTSNTPSLRLAGATGATTPKAGGMTRKAIAQRKEDIDGDEIHIATLHMMNLVETLRDFVDMQICK